MRLSPLVCTWLIRVFRVHVCPPQIRGTNTLRSLLDKGLYFQPKVPASSLLLTYIRENPEVMLMSQDWFMDGEEEEIGEDEELKAVGTPARITPRPQGSSTKEIAFFADEQADMEADMERDQQQQQALRRVPAAAGGVGVRDP
jgi:hypothetical protein